MNIIIYGIWLVLLHVYYHHFGVGEIKLSMCLVVFFFVIIGIVYGDKKI